MNNVTVENAAEVAKTVKGGAVVGPTSVRRSPSIVALMKALHKAQSELRNPPKDSVNPHFKSRYSDLATVRECVQPVFLKNSLVVLMLQCELDDSPALTTILSHTDSGEWIETTAKLRPTKPDPQQVGSALTYARRYALLTIAGVVGDDDDDGNAASQHKQPAQQKTLAERCIEAVRSVKSRDALTDIYRNYEVDLKAGKFTPAEKTQIEEAFRTAGEKFPKPAPKG